MNAFIDQNTKEQKRNSWIVISSIESSTWKFQISNIQRDFCKSLSATFLINLLFYYTAVYLGRGENFFKEQSMNRISALNSKGNSGKRTELGWLGFFQFLFFTFCEVDHSQHWILPCRLKELSFAFCTASKEALNLLSEFTYTRILHTFTYVYTHRVKLNPKSCWEKLKLCQDQLL